MAKRKDRHGKLNRKAREDLGREGQRGKESKHSDERLKGERERNRK